MKLIMQRPRKLRLTKREKPYKPWFDSFSCAADYEDSGIIPIEPMTAKEVMDSDMKKVMTSDEYIVEEKIDGERGILQFTNFEGRDCARVFSRRVSKKTGFYNEKSDSLPQIRNISIPSLFGTIIDGEMRVPKKSFKVTSSILNCLPEEAIERQRSEGEVVFHAFDCIYYKGRCIADLPLYKRKEYLAKVMRELQKNGVKSIVSIPYGTKIEFHNGKRLSAPLDKMEYFKLIVSEGGEGVMVKNINAPYEFKRTRAFQKIKRRVYRDVVIVGYSMPTKEYDGKFPKDNWEYWINPEGKKTTNTHKRKASEMLRSGFIPITKNWFLDYVGGVIYGVVVTDSEYEKMREVKGAKAFNFVELDGIRYVIVGTCEGIDDVTRARFSKARGKYLGKVFEVEGNEIFNDTGKIRHPRFYRFRPDKEASSCTWKEHINE